MQVERMRAFIIKFVFYCIIAGLVFVALKYVMPILMPFVLGFFFAFLLKPLIDWVTVKSRVKRAPVAVFTLLVFYVIMATLCIVLGTRIVVLIRDVFYGLPTFYQTVLEPAIFSIQDSIERTFVAINPSLLVSIESIGESLAKSLSGLVSGISTRMLSWATGVAGSLPTMFVNIIITIVVSFFCVVDYYKITSFLLRQLPKKASEMVFKIKNKGVDVIFKFGKAYAILLSITFLELWIGLSLLRIENAFLIALVTCVVDILPILGTGTVLIPWGIDNLILGHYPLGAGLLILYLIITVIRQSLEPRIVGKQIGLYPLIALICMFVGGALFGFLGLFGLPIVATIFVQLNETENFHLIK